MERRLGAAATGTGPAGTSVPPSAPQVSGEWFLAGMASNQPKLLKEDKDAGLLVHRIQVTPKALQLHLHKK